MSPLAESNRTALTECGAPTDYLDLFLIHDPLGGQQKRLDTWRALIRLRDDGKLKSIGVSN